MPIDVEKFKHLTSQNKDLKVEYKPLNFEKLLKTGAFRVTHKGLDDGTYDPNPDNGFSLVSAYNDAVGENTKKWKDNPKAYPVVMEMFYNRPNNIGAHKYLQIVNSAKQLGLSDEDIYLSDKKFPLPAEYSDGGRISFI